jgi:CheY-like chemotaxis protein
VRQFWKLIGILGGMGCVAAGVFILLSNRPSPVETEALAQCIEQQVRVAAWEARVERYHGDLRETAWSSGVHPYLEMAPANPDPLADQRLQEALDRWPAAGARPEGLVLAAERCWVIATAGDTSGFGDLCCRWLAQGASGFAVLRPWDGSSSPFAVLFPEKQQNHRDARLWALYPAEAATPLAWAHETDARWLLMDRQGRSLVTDREIPWAHHVKLLVPKLRGQASGVLAQPDGSVLAWCTTSAGGSEPLFLCQTLYPTETSEAKLAYVALGLGAVLILLAGLAGSRSKSTPPVASDPAEGTRLSDIRTLGEQAKEVAETLPVGTPSSPGQEELERTSTVMIIDENDVVRSLAERMLRRCGFRCLPMRTGAEALSELAADPDCADVAFIEVTVPDHGGIELARCLRDLQPGLKVVLMGSVVEVPPDQVLQEEGVSAFLAKPFQVKSLIGAVQTALGQDWPSGERRPK